MDVHLHKAIGPDGCYCPPSILLCSVVAKLSVNKVTHVKWGGRGVFDVKSISWVRCASVVA